jgi:hypothetical protein
MNNLSDWIPALLTGVIIIVLPIVVAIIVAVL